MFFLKFQVFFANLLFLSCRQWNLVYNIIMVEYTEKNNIQFVENSYSGRILKIVFHP